MNIRHAIAAIASCVLAAGCGGPRSDAPSIPGTSTASIAQHQAKIPQSQASYDLLYSFSTSKYASLIGVNPYGGVFIDTSEQNAHIVGTSLNGSDVSKQKGLGSIFKVALAGGNPVQVHAFTGAPGDGAFPFGQFAYDAATGGLYGTTGAGGAGPCSKGCGSVYEITPDGNEGYNYDGVVYSFQGASKGDGQSPQSGVIVDPKTGWLWGTTTIGGEYKHGTVYALAPQGSALVNVFRYSFKDGSDGGKPVGELVEDANGNFFGTAADGGAMGSPCPAKGCGTLFEIVASGSGYSFQVLHDFAGGPNDGASPQSAPIIDSSGTLYGTTQFGGSNDQGSGTTEIGGTLWELPSPYTGTPTILHNFPANTSGYVDGLRPQGSPFLLNGTLYGTTLGGGSGKCVAEGDIFTGCGIVYAQPLSGTYQPLLSFIGKGRNEHKPLGQFPYAGVTALNSGSNVLLVGVAYNGGETGGTTCPSGCGVLYSLTEQANSLEYQR